MILWLSNYSYRGIPIILYEMCDWNDILKMWCIQDYFHLQPDGEYIVLNTLINCIFITICPQHFHAWGWDSAQLQAIPILLYKHFYHKEITPMSFIA